MYVMKCLAREMSEKNISIPPVIAGNAFVDRGFSMGEIIFIPPISLPYLSRPLQMLPPSKRIRSDVWLDVVIQPLGVN